MSCTAARQISGRHLTTSSENLIRNFISTLILALTNRITSVKSISQLRAIDLISNLDVDALARLVIAQEKYIAVTQELNRQPIMVEIEIATKQLDEYGQPVKIRKEVVNGEVERLALLQDRYFKQCRQGAADFGLTVSSRCRLVVPKADKETPKENKFAKFA